MKNLLYTLFVLYLSLFLGKALYTGLGGLPGSLYGMIIFSLLLHFKLFDPAKMEQSIQWVIQHMGVCFVPAGVGIINHFELIKQHGFTIVAIIFFTTFLLMTVVGLAYERFTKSNKIYLKEDKNAS